MPIYHRTYSPGELQFITLWNRRFHPFNVYTRVAQTCRFLACLRPARPEGRIHADKNRRHVCATRPRYTHRSPP